MGQSCVGFKALAAFSAAPHRMEMKLAGLRSLRMALLAFLAAGVGTFTVIDCALSEPNFPAKPIGIFIPYGAGGVADLTMRLLAQKLTERLRQYVTQLERTK